MSMVHVRKRIERPDSKIIEAFRDLDVATVYEASGRKGYIAAAIKPITKGVRICGPAFTVQCAPGDNLMLHKALQIASPGDVLVATVGNEPEYGYWGGMMAVSALARKLGGLAIDGCIRDSAEIIRMGFPIFCRGFSIRGTTKDILGLINYPVNFGNMTIYPGDLILGDDDGMVVVRRTECEAVLEKSRKRVEAEKMKSDQLRQGVSSVELNKLQPVFDALGCVEE
ncbi:MAG: 4-carboxy-4-hydroxy-2-oxoadipate aldolase/oxaloacetate decarboxylase [Spirochaetes bacterium]|nr:4-carboxy-4-hydroxy-2-oxoadipate aldolase/oxaloacetate decarboxylase [Spirochaetota bacterium]